MSFFRPNVEHMEPYVPGEQPRERALPLHAVKGVAGCALYATELTVGEVSPETSHRKEPAGSIGFENGLAQRIDSGEVLPETEGSRQSAGDQEGDHAPAPHGP